MAKTRRVRPSLATLPALGPLEQVPPGKLKGYASNARRHSDRQIALIVHSIEAFGFINPIIAEADGTIIAGHGRWEAAKQLGLQDVPVLWAHHLTSTKARAYRLDARPRTHAQAHDRDLWR